MFLFIIDLYIVKVYVIHIDLLKAFVKIYYYVGLSNNKYGQYLKSKTIEYFINILIDKSLFK